MKQFRDIHFVDLSSHAVRHELHQYGYILIRRLFSPEDLEPLLHQVTQVLAAHDWLLPGSDLIVRHANAAAACGENDAAFKLVYERVFNLESLHSLAHHPRLRSVMDLLTGPRLLIHPKPMARLVFPDCDRFIIQPHQDHLAIGGALDCFTAWTPLHDCLPEAGPLRILEGSHRHGFRQADPATGTIREDNAPPGEWAGGAIYAGDVLIFHALTIHSASPNTSSQIRISMDCRFQDYALPIHPANLAFPSSNDRSWESTYAGWQSQDLQYFWRQLPLTFQPSLEQLSEMAVADESERMRTRYSRILNQLTPQMTRQSLAGSLL